MRILFSIIFVSFSLLCQADETSSLLTQAKTAFERYTHDAHFHDYSTAFGDINNDGIQDFVTFIGDPNYNDNGVEDLKIAVFIGSKNNTFKYYTISSDIFGHERVSHNLDIAKQSIYLHRDGSGGCCSHWVEEFQFKMRDNRLMLIGIETSNFHPEGITDPDTGMSANLLTKKVIKWTYEKKHRKEKMISAPSLNPIPFEDFNYDTITDKWAEILW